MIYACTPMCCLYMLFYILFAWSFVIMYHFNRFYMLCPFWLYFINILLYNVFLTMLTSRAIYILNMIYFKCISCLYFLLIWSHLLFNNKTFTSVFIFYMYALYIYRTYYLCRILALVLMFLVLKTTINKVYLILSYLMPYMKMQWLIKL